MKYDSVILELLARIQALEEKVEELSSGSFTPGEVPMMQVVQMTPVSPELAGKRPAPKVSTSDIRVYIEEQKRAAAENGEPVLILKASAIHRALKMKNRIPMVTNAMRQCMAEGDEVLHDTPSGKSSTLEIKYYLPAVEEPQDAEDPDGSEADDE